MADEPLFAVVIRSGNITFRKRAQPLVAVLSGILSDQDEIEVVGSDELVRPAHVHAIPGGRLSPADKDTLVTLDGLAGSIAPGDVMRRHDEGALALPVSGPAARARATMLQAVQWARAGGLTGPTAEVFARLPDEAVVLFTERRLRHSLARHTSPYAMRDDFEDAAAALETIGLPVDADRLRLTAAAALEGHAVAPSIRALADAASVGSLVVSDAVDTVTGHAGIAGRALNLDVGEGFALGFQQGYTVMGEEIRTRLQAAGRAVALGWCPRCRDVVRLDERLRCAHDGKRARDVVVAVPDDVTVTVAELRRRAGR